MTSIAIQAFGLKEVEAAMYKARAAIARENMIAASMVSKRLERNWKLRLTGNKSRDPFWGVIGAKGDMLGVRSGELRSSITSQVVKADRTHVVIVGTPSQVMKLHEEGGTLHGSPYLRIPTAVMQTGAGVDRLKGRSARVLGNTFVQKSKRGNLFIFMQARGRRDAPTALYMLKQNITYRARHIAKGVLATDATFIRDTVAGRFSIAMGITR